MGEGKRLLLAFHGYGHEGSTLHIFTPWLQAAYTCYFIDLPHHGGSHWPEKAALQPAGLAKLAQYCMDKEQVTQFSLLGYSMGGRICLQLVELLPAQIDKVTLLATDGLETDLFYYLMVRNPLGKSFFKMLTERPERILQLLNWLHRKGWLAAQLHKIATYHLGNAASRDLLSRVWPAMAALIPNRKKVRNSIQQFKIPVAIFMGRYDKLMPPARAQRFAAGLPTVQVEVLEKGHRVFDAGNAGLIAASLLH
jgi:pimeloyl-ACP methyl ester carboxylesterase